MIKFDVRPPPPSPNVRDRLHWAKRNKLNKDIAWRVWVGVHLNKSKASVPKYGRIIVHATRHAIQMMDRDNFTGSLKPVIDGLVDCSIVPNDTMELVKLGELDQKRCRRMAEERLEIRVEEWK